MANAMGVSIGVKVDEQYSKQNIKKFLDDTAKNNMLKLGTEIDTKQLNKILTNATKDLGKVLDLSLDFGADGKTISALQTVLALNGDILKVRQNIKVLREDEEDPNSAITGYKAEHNHVKLIEKFETERKNKYNELLKLTKEKGNLELAMDKAKKNNDENQLAILRQQTVEVKKQITQQNNAIKKGGFEDAQLQAIIDKQKEQNKFNMSLQEAKNLDAKQIEQYNIKIKAVEDEYKYRKLLVNATDEEVDKYGKLIQMARSQQGGATTAINKLGLQNDALDKAVTRTKEIGQYELKSVETKKQQADLLEKQKTVYTQIIAQEKEFRKNYTTSVNKDGTEQGILANERATQNLLELDRLRNQVKTEGLYSETLELDVLEQQRLTENQIQALKAKGLDAENASILAAQKKREEAQAHLATEKQIIQAQATALLGGQNANFVSVSEVNAVITKLEQLDAVDMKSVKAELKGLKAELTQIGTNADNARIQSLALTNNNLSSSLKNLAFYANGAMIISRLWMYMRQGIQDVVALDDAITTLNMTMSQLSGKEIEGLVDGAKDMAEDLSASLDNVLLSVKTVANANETIDTILAKSQSAVVLSNLTGLDTSVTVDAVQGALKAFDDLADGTEEDAMRVSDAMVSISENLGMDFSAGIQGMTDSLSTIGSFANQVGLSLEGTLGMVSGIAEATRLSFDEVATGMRNIMSRVFRVSDGETTSEDMLKAEKALDSFNIKIRNMDGTMRDFDEVMVDVSKEWQHMSEIEQQYLADAMG